MALPRLRERPAPRLGITTLSLALAGMCVSSVPLCLTACSGGFFPAPFATDPSPAESSSAGPRAPFLAIGELRWSRGAETVVHLRENGTLEDHGVVLGTLGPDGVFKARGGARTL